MGYYSRSQGKFVSGQAPAKVSPISFGNEPVDSTNYDSLGTVSFEDNNLPTITTTSKYPLDKYQSDLKNDILYNEGKNATNLERLYKASNPEPTATEKADSLEQQKITSSAESAKKLLDLFNKKNAGEISGDEYQSALNFLVSDYNSKRAFGEGGKNVTDIERQMLGGQLINVDVLKPNVWERGIGWYSGKTPATTSEVGEDEAAIRNKMINSIKKANPNADLSLYQVEQKQPVGSEKETFKPNLVENVLNNAKDIVTGLGQLPEIVTRMQGINPETAKITDLIGLNIPRDPVLAASTAYDMGKAMIDDLGKTTGVSYSDGKFHWDGIQALVHDYNHPIDTALWILPFLKYAKSAKGGGIINKAAKESSLAEKSLAEFSEAGTKLPEISSRAGKAARSVATIVPESVVKSEEIMSKALRDTKSLSIEGMAKELERSIPTQGRAIEQWAKTKDAKIGVQPMENIVDQVIERVKNTSSGQANPDLVNTVKDILNKQLQAGYLDENAVYHRLNDAGIGEATNFTSINETRKYLTSGLNSWFNSGSPLGSPTNDLNAMKWEAANTLKDIIAQADDANIVKEALGKQHNAFQTYPVLSRMVSDSGPGLNALSLKWSLIRKAWNATGGKATEALNISRARGLQTGSPTIGLPPITTKPFSPGVIPPTNPLYYTTPLIPSVTQPEESNQQGKQSNSNVVNNNGQQDTTSNLNHGSILPPITSKQVSSMSVPKGGVKVIPTETRVTQTFGNRNKIEKFSGGVNRGVDFSVKQNTPLSAPNGEWEVADAYGSSRRKGYIGNGTNGGYGNSVLLVNRKTGEKIRLSHLNRVDVEKGDVIQGGNTIGLSGSTGNSTGNHVDCEYYNAQGKLADILKSPYKSAFI